MNNQAVFGMLVFIITAVSEVLLALVIGGNVGLTAAYFALLAVAAATFAFRRRQALLSSALLLLPILGFCAGFVMATLIDVALHPEHSWLLGEELTWTPLVALELLPALLIIVFAGLFQRNHRKRLHPT